MPLQIESNRIRYMTGLDPDQPVHMHNLISGDPELTTQLCSLIWIYSGCICHKVNFIWTSVLPDESS